MQVGDDLLDLPPIVEPGTSNHLEWQATAYQLFLEDTGLRVGSVEDCDLAVGDPGADEAVDLPDHELGFVSLVPGHDAGDRVALPVCRPQFLGVTFCQSGLDGLGGDKDRLGRAVVLFEADRGALGEVLFELQDVADVCATPSVDRLRVVTNDGQVAVVAGDGLDEAVLGFVDVLVLVDEDMPVPVGVALPNVREVLEQLQHEIDQIAEVDRVGRLEGVLIPPVEGCDGGLEGVVGLARTGSLRWADQSVLQSPDCAQDGVRADEFRVESGLGELPLEDAQLIVGVVDGEVPVVAPAKQFDIRPQKAGTKSVEGSHPDLACLILAGEFGHSVGKFAGGLVGECDGEDLPWWDLALPDDVGDPVGDDPGLARSGACKDQEGTIPVGDGIHLGRIELGGKELPDVR